MGGKKRREEGEMEKRQKRKIGSRDESGSVWMDGPIQRVISWAESKQTVGPHQDASGFHGFVS